MILFPHIAVVSGRSFDVASDYIAAGLLNLTNFLHISRHPVQLPLYGEWGVFIALGNSIKTAKLKVSQSRKQGKKENA